MSLARLQALKREAVKQMKKTCPNLQGVNFWRGMGWEYFGPSNGWALVAQDALDYMEGDDEAEGIEEEEDAEVLDGCYPLSIDCTSDSYQLYSLL